MEQLVHDIRFALRRLRKSPGFTTVAVLTLALGIGGNTAIFTLIHALMLKSLPVSDPQQLYRLGDRDACCVISGYQTRFAIFSSSLYQYLRDHTPEFTELAAAQADRVPLSVRQSGASSPPDSLVGEFVSGNYFSMFGIRGFAGRLFTAADDRPGTPPLGVISYHVWEQRYNLDPGVIGSTFIVNGTPITIAGIAPPGFFGDSLRVDPADFWLPLATEPLLRGKNSVTSHSDQHWLYLIGRLKPGTRPDSVESKVNVELKQWWIDQTGSRLSAKDAQQIAKQHATLTPAGSGVAGMKNQYADGLKLLISVSGLVLLIACANIANLLLARGMKNRIQSSIRLALGAQRALLMRQAMIESMVLAVAGGVAGLLVAWTGTRALLFLAFGGAAFVPIEARPSLFVLAFAFLLSLITGVLFGAIPAWSAARFDPIDAIRGAGRGVGSRGTWLQRSLVIMQAALSLVLLTSAGLLTESLRNLENQKFGFETGSRVDVRVNPSFNGYSPERLALVYQRLQERLPQIPGVRSAGFSLYSPMRGGAWSSGIAIEGRQGNTYSAMWDRVSPHYFETIGTPRVRGRLIDESDTPTSRRVAVVSRTFADRYFKNEDALGKRFGFGSVEHSADFEIVGIVDDAKYTNPREPADPMFFLPYLQMLPSDWSNSAWARSNFVQDIQLRIDASARDLDVQVRRTLQDVDPNLTVLKIATFGEQLSRNFNRERLIARLTEVFGLLALALAGLGLYGVTAYSVARRTSEFGIRTALGASRLDVIGMVLRGAFLQIGCGVAIGTPVALAAGRLLASQLYGVKVNDPLALGGATLLLFACALMAGLIPARRATQVDPMEALRTE
jgi:macrolide transport system ATP-binding/permease protein